MMSNKRELRIQTAVLLVLLPMLFLITGMVGYLVYSSLYRDIIRTFDHKLRSVSTVTGAFIDVDEHDRLLEAYQVTALVFEHGSGRLVAAVNDGSLLNLDPNTGSGLPIGSAGRSPIWDLAQDPLTGDLWALSGEPPELLRIDSETMGVLSVKRLSAACRALASDPQSGDLYCAAGALYRLDWKSGHCEVIAALPSQVTALAPALESGWAYAVSDTGLLRVRLETGWVEEVGPFRIQGETPEQLPAETERDGVPLRGITLLPDGRLLGAAMSLAEIDQQTAALELFGYNGYRSEQSQVYRKYVEPMQRIKEATDLTYLYTFVLGGNQSDIIYVLDASIGEDHSSIGDIDADTPDSETVGVWRNGGYHLSEIEEWEQWGLIKSGDAAVYDRQGSVRAIAGADVNISIIREKTRSALFRVCLMGGICLLLGCFAAVKVSDKLVQPIEKLKNQALKVAAGQFGQSVRVGSPAELRDLAGSFNEMSHALEETLEDLSRSNREIERDRRRAELVLTLAKSADASMAPPAQPIRYGRLGNRPVRRDGSGWLWGQGHFYCWIAEHDEATPLEAVQFRSDLACILGRLVDRTEGDWSRITRFMEGLFASRLEALIRFDPQRCEIRGLSHGSAPFLCCRGDDPVVEVVRMEQPFGRLLVPDEVVVFSSASAIRAFSAWARSSTAVGRESLKEFFETGREVDDFDTMFAAFGRES